MNNYFTTYRSNSVIEYLNDNGKSKVSVLHGGMSAEREVSLSSIKVVIAALLNLGYHVTTIDVGADIAQALTKTSPDIIFNCLHGTYGEDGCITGLLNMLRIPYTHCGVNASVICFNKNLTRYFLAANGFNIAHSIFVHKHEELTEDPLPRPYVIKPLNQGSSVGVEIVLTDDNYQFADYKFEYGSTVVVEKFLKGQELQIAVLNGKAYGALEVKPINRKFYDYEAKYVPGMSEHILPAIIPNHILDEALSNSEKIFTLLSCRGLIRVEFIYVNEEQKLYVLEINTHPGMTPTSSAPEILQYYGINSIQMVEKCLQSAQYD